MAYVSYLYGEFKTHYMSIKSKTLSFQSIELLDQLYQAQLLCFGIDKANKLLPNSNPDAVKRLLSDMTKRGLLMRIKDGLYYIIPFEQEASTFMPDWHLLSQYIVGDANYYIGYFSALQIHSLTTQPNLKEQIVVSKQIKPSLLKVKASLFNSFITTKNISSVVKKHGLTASTKFNVLIWKKLLLIVYLNQVMQVV